jgi:hypothetical protein
MIFSRPNFYLGVNIQSKFKLFAMILACGLFLVGCGGGGGSNDGNDGEQASVSPSISFANLENVFPSFPSETNIYKVIKEKQYNISKNAFDDFNASVLVYLQLQYHLPHILSA